jgi:hypothetical protein
LRTPVSTSSAATGRDDVGARLFSFGRARRRSRSSASNRLRAIRGFDRIDYLTLKYGGKKEKKGARLGVDEGLDPLSFVRAAFGYYLLKE